MLAKGKKALEILATLIEQFIYTNKIYKIFIVIVVKIK